MITLIYPRKCFLQSSFVVIMRYDFVTVFMAVVDKQILFLSDASTTIPNEKLVLTECIIWHIRWPHRNHNKEHEAHFRPRWLRPEASIWEHNPCHNINKRTQCSLCNYKSQKWIILRCFVQNAQNQQDFKTFVELWRNLQLDLILCTSNIQEPSMEELASRQLNLYLRLCLNIETLWRTCSE